MSARNSNQYVRNVAQFEYLEQNGQTALIMETGIVKRWPWSRHPEVTFHVCVLDQDEYVSVETYGDQGAAQGHLEALTCTWDSSYFGF